MQNKNVLEVFTDASHADYVAATACVAVYGDLIVEQHATAYETSSIHTEHHELIGIANALKLAVKVIRRKKFKDINVVVLCDNLESIKRAATDKDVHEQLNLLRAKGCNAMISYVNGNHIMHNLCHVTSGTYRMRVKPKSAVVDNAMKKTTGYMTSFMSLKSKQIKENQK